MSRSTFTMAAAALAATASAAYSASSTQNVVVYWGQGSNVDLSTVCQDSSIDVVALAFVNRFPKAVGEYPGSNFANSCWQQFPDPMDSTKESKLLNCPNFEAGIKTCHDNGKKVLLSLGGGYPTDYYLPDESVAKYFAGWLLDAFGPLKSGYTGPRPFGNEAVDGFDLDLEAKVAEVPSEDFIWKNYAALVNEVKRLQPSTLITAAPQCPVEDPRLADAIKNSHFDMIFTQFYNTRQCSARVGFTELSTGTTEFTFQKWSKWLLANSQNKAVKLYMGLPAGVAGAGNEFPDHYLKPEEAYQLVSKWKAATSNFGGVMLWSHTVSNNNVNNCKSYSYWMKATLEGSFRSQYSAKACASSSSSVRPSTTSSVRPSSSSVRVSSSSVRVSSSSVRVSSSSARPSSSSALPSSSKVLSSSSSVLSSSSKVIVSSSSVVPSSTSGAPIPTATLPTTDGTCGIKSSGVAYTCAGYNGGECCSEYGYCGGNENGANTRSAYCGTGCNPLFGTCDGISSSSAVQSSSAAPSPSSSSVATSSAVQSSSVATSSSAVQSSSVATSSSAVQSSYVATSSSAVQSSSVAASSSVIHSSSASVSVSVSSAQSSASASASKHDSSSVVVSSSASVHASSSVYSASAPVVSSSASVDASSSVASSSAHVDSSSVYTTSHVPYPTGGSSVFPSFSSVPYPIYNVSRSHDVPVYPAETPVGPSSTPCSTSSKPVVPTSSSKPSYPEYPASSSKPSYPEYSASSSKPSYPEYPASSSKPSYPEYPAISKLVVPSSKPVPGYPESPASSTIKVITTTYVDICETGVTTKTETITKTVCNKCNKPEEDSVTSVYVCNNCGPSAVTVTITKPNVPATGVPAKPTGPSYGGDKPSAPVYGGEKPQTPAQPSGPSYGNDKPNQPVYSVDIKKQNDATSTTVEIVYVTKTPVAAVPSYTPVGYPSGPAKNGTSGYPIQPSGTGVPTKLTGTGTGVPTKPTYAPPQFTGAASRLGAGLAGVVAIAAGLLVL